LGISARAPERHDLAALCQCGPQMQAAANLGRHLTGSECQCIMRISLIYHAARQRKGMVAPGRKGEAYSNIKSAIMSGELLPGTQLSPADLATQYGMSRTPVRDALNALVQEGLVEVQPRRGYFVSHITVRDVEEVFQLRLILETASAELAATRITPDQIEQLARLSSRYVAGDPESYRSYLDENRQFHLTVAEAAGNRLLVGVLRETLEQMHRFLVLRLDLSDDADQMLAEHYLLLDAFRKRDSARAREAMRIAIEHARDAVLESIFKRGKDWVL